MDDVRRGFAPAAGMDYDRAFEYADEYGLDFVEVYTEGEPWREGALSDAEAVRERLDRHDLGLTAHLPFPLALGSPATHVQEGALTALDEYVEGAAARGAERAVLHLAAPSREVANRTPAQTRPTLLESARRATEIGREHGVEVCAENLFTGPFTIDEFDAVLDETDISMTLDTGHAAITGWTAEEVAGFIDDYGDRIAHVHVNDNRANVESWRTEDEHLPVGAGTVDFETILAPVVAGEWSPTLAMEIVTWDPAYVQASVDRLDELLAA
jgi:sugar phosphate isomerase/epimerase